MRVLLDTNIIMDWFLGRQPHVEQVAVIIKMCTEDKIKGCIAAHTVTNLFFILRNEFSVEKRRLVLLDLCNEFKVIGIDASKLISALKNNNFNDFEDCLQDECAMNFNADYIITRNTADFKNSKIKAVNPIKFLEKIN
ncbi:MAG: PIN domain-containing protein [Oscillospiraceae bacterium]|nr:PIN domain-containing protein [Oscillospiraceae bacterium]